MELLNHTLPIQGTMRITSVLQANNLPFQVPSEDSDDGYDRHYNCWGYVAFNFGWEKTARWLDGRTMETHLATHTTPITESQASIGDIAVFRWDAYLTHTALMTHESNIICHKPGAGPLCVDTMERAKRLYHSVVSYVRPKKVDKR